MKVSFFARTEDVPINQRRTRWYSGLSSIIGLCFFLGFLIFNKSLKDFVNDSQKWTFQSNLVAFVTALLYTIKPNAKIFRKNTLILFSGSNLFLAGFGFWFILLPTGFANLPDYIIPVDVLNRPNVKNWETFSTYFFGVWNHLVTQIFYFIFLLIAFKNSNQRHLYPIRFSRLITIIFIWLTIYTLIFVIALPFIPGWFPVYGIFTNFNPWTTHQMKNGQFLYDLKISSITMCAIYLNSSLIAFFNWRTCIQYNVKTINRYMEKID